jgi:hypothetical protein
MFLHVQVGVFASTSADSLSRGIASGSAGYPTGSVSTLDNRIAHH